MVSGNSGKRCRSRRVVLFRPLAHPDVRRTAEQPVPPVPGLRGGYAVRDPCGSVWRIAAGRGRLAVAAGAIAFFRILGPFRPEHEETAAPAREACSSAVGGTMVFEILGWYIGLLGSIVSIAGLYYFARSLTKLSGELWKVLFMLFLASAGVLLFSTLLVIFGIVRLSLGNPLWQIAPVFFLLTAILYILSTRKLTHLVEKLSGKQPRTPRYKFSR